MLTRGREERGHEIVANTKASNAGEPEQDVTTKLDINYGYQIGYQIGYQVWCQFYSFPFHPIFLNQQGGKSIASLYH